MLMNFHESRTPGVLYTGFWRYKPSHGAAGALMSAAACIVLGRMMLIFFQDDGEITMEKVQQAAGLCIAGCLLFYFGTTLFFSFFTGYSTKLVVSEEGVRYGNRFYSWSRLAWIDARLKDGGYQIHISKRRGFFREKRLTIDDGLSEEQWERLLNHLKERVLPRYAHLRAGDDAHSVMQQRALPDAPVPGTVRSP